MAGDRGPHPAVQAEIVARALRQRAVILCNTFGFDPDDRRALASMILNRPDLQSFTELDDRECRRLVFALESSALVIELLRQNRHRRESRPS